MSQSKSPRVPPSVLPPRLLPWLGGLLLLFALLTVNSAYLGAITVLETASGRSWQDGVYLSMFLAHLGLGLALILPFAWFGIAHLRRAWRRPNRDAVRAGLGVFASGWIVILSGLLLTRFDVFEINDPGVRGIAYWAHVIGPFAVAWLFVLHRLAGPRIRWRKGLQWGAIAMLATVLGGGYQIWQHDTDSLTVTRFEPGLAKIATRDGRPIPAAHLMGDAGCAECHADIAEHAKLSVHRFSSFNNPAYRFSIEDTRKVMLARDGNVEATRFCAVCHDLAPLFSGAFDDPDFDGDSASAQAGITCLGCHAIQSVDSPRGNGDYTIVDPPRYPFAHSDNAFLKAVNHQLIKAKPAFHKKTLLKPMHKTAEFCASCHKVHLPQALNHYKWLRGQDHYDSFLFSGVSGHRIDSFYYPPKAIQNCAACHMPARESDDPAARDFAATGKPSVHSHGFVAANTGVAALRGEPELGLAERRGFLENTVRLDLFGLRRDGQIDGELIAPLRPQLPTLQPGGRYLIDTVVRTVKLGHHLTQGTVDSNELWLEVTVRMGDPENGRIIAHSGGLGARDEVDPDAYFLNAWLLDRDGNKIDRRNAQDIFVALYNHQIPPGAASVVHYRLDVPPDADGPITVEAALHYRKFTSAFLGHVRGDAYRGNDLPIVTIARDSVTLPVGDAAVAAQTRDVPLWQRWNDYGIGLLRNAAGGGTHKGELRQAAEAFAQVEALGYGDGALNQARVHFREGDLDRAAADLVRAGRGGRPAPPWTRAWFSAQIDRQLGNLERAAQTLEAIADTRFNDARARGFDFGVDTRVRNLLGRTLFDLARRERGDARKTERDALLARAEAQFQAALAVDPEDLGAHYNLAKLYAQRGETGRADEHRRLHARYKPDDQAIERAVTLARSRNPIANRTAEAIAIYPLAAPSTPRLAERSTLPDPASIATPNADPADTGT